MTKETVGAPQMERRPLASRSSGWARWLAARLTMSQVTPNQISLLSVAWAALGGALLFWGAGWLVFIAAAACVQLRLICNLLDGMVAIEGGKSTQPAPCSTRSPTVSLIRCSWCRSAMLQVIRGSAGLRRFLPSLQPMSAFWVAR